MAKKKAEVREQQSNLEDLPVKTVSARNLETGELSTCCRIELLLVKIQIDIFTVPMVRELILVKPTGETNRTQSMLLFKCVTAQYSTVYTYKSPS